jgi:hypothetical protein
VIKQKRWRNETAVLPSLNKYSRCYFFTKTISLFLELCVRL